MLTNGCPENTSSGYTHWTCWGLVRRQVLHEPLSEADAAHFLVFLSPGSSSPTIG